MTDHSAGGTTRHLRGPLGARTGYRVMKLGERIKVAAQETLAPLGVRLRHFDVLTTLATSEPLSQQDLSRSLGIDPNVMVSILDDLESLGLAERRRNPADRRRHVVAVTDDGLRLLKEGAALLDAAEARIFAAISAKDLASIHNATGQLLESPWPPAGTPTAGRATGGESAPDC